MDVPNIKEKEKMIKTKEEILNSIKAKIGDSTEDADLALLEDISDTFDDMTSRVTEAGDWKTKYEENDKAWKQKYRDRFFNPDADKDIQQKLAEEEHEEEPPKKLTFDNLFVADSNKEKENGGE